MTRTAIARVRWTARIVLALVMGALLVVVPRDLHADARTDFLIGRLKADDFRVRTNAALALGQSGDPAALAPLCGALSDASDVVRQAVVAALQKLGAAGGAACLKDRRPSEPSPSVQRAIDRALAVLATSGPSAPSNGGPPAVVANAKYYVSLSPIANQTGRPDDDIARVVGGAIRGKLGELGGFQIAPDRESPEQARAAMSKRKLTGFYLSIRVEKFDYADGNLRVRVKIAVFTYPGKDLRGEVPAGLTQSGVSPGDKAAEDNLLQLASARATELFAQNFQ